MTLGTHYNKNCSILSLSILLPNSPNYLHLFWYISLSFCFMITICSSLNSYLDSEDILEEEIFLGRQKLYPGFCYLFFFLFDFCDIILKRFHCFSRCLPCFDRFKEYLPSSVGNLYKRHHIFCFFVLSHFEVSQNLPYFVNLHVFFSWLFFCFMKTSPFLFSQQLHFWLCQLTTED